MNIGVGAAALLMASTLGFAQQTVTFPSRDGKATLKADLYGSGTRAVILAHGGPFGKESWKKQAEALAQAGFLAVAVQFRGDGKNPNGSPGSFGNDEENAADIEAAVEYLHKKGIRDISGIGGSMGGSALGLAAAELAAGTFRKVVFLGSEGGDQPEKLTDDKLFLVAREDSDGAGPRLPGIQANFARAPEPKKLVVVEGAAHAQYLFETPQGEAVWHEILQFLQGR